MAKAYFNFKRKCFFRLFCLWVLISFTLNLFFCLVPSYAQTILSFPHEAAFGAKSQVYVPIFIKGMVINPQDPFKIDFIIDTGTESTPSQHVGEGRAGGQLKEESTKLIKYFLASLTIPEKEVWVNLSPYEKERIIPDDFSRTEMGRDLLWQDYLLKQITASFFNPENKAGKKFWDKIFEKTKNISASPDISLNILSKVWIVPDQAVVYESGNTVVVLKSRLKVMAQEDYQDAQSLAFDSRGQYSASSPGYPIDQQHMVTQIFKETILPEIEQEINTGKTFAPLRQIYHSVILATWYKNKLHNSPLNQIYSNQRKVAGMAISGEKIKQQVYEQYLEAFRRGIYGFIKEDYDPETQQIIPRKYFSGGVALVSSSTLKTEGPRTHVLGTAETSAVGHFEVARTDFQVVSQSDEDSGMLAEIDPSKNMIPVILEHVIEPVSGPLPSYVKVSRAEDGTIFVEHKGEYKGQRYHFQYEIRFTDSVLKTPKISSLDAVNIIELPSGPWNGERTKSARDAWRRMTIADPVLYKRFSRTFIEPSDYQVEAARRNVTSLKENGHGLTVMATGTGKTFIGFKTVVDYLDSLKQVPSEEGESPGAVLFLVNNQIILKEAEEGLERIYPGRFKVGRIYGGDVGAEVDAYSEETNFIFATPASLVTNKNRIERLLKTKKIDAVIVDEVHHLPSATNRMLFRRLQEENSQTRFLGLTATETRTDRISVISFFGNDITYEYPTTQGWGEGFLTPISYLNADGDILEHFHLTPERVNFIEEGSDVERAWKGYIYSDQRFPYLYGVYQKQTGGRRDDRTLILAPNVERAKALAAYFANRGVQAVTLTSQDRQEDPVLFEHNYHAWKTGNWLQDSPYQGRPVPKVVVAVSIFREGADVPAINNIILWFDTNSTVAFIQSIGRGLRPAPLKTNLTVIDTVGLHRKLHILKYLGVLMGREDSFGPGGDKDKRRKTADELSEPPLVLTEDVTRTVEKYFSDVPSRLESRFGAYSLIPLKFMEELDRYFALKLGLLVDGNPSLEKLKEKMADVAQRLAAKPTEAQVKAIRWELINIFESSFFGIDVDAQETISLIAGVVIVFQRLADLITRIDPSLNEAHLYPVFPEFNPRLKQMVRNRGRNMQILRKIVFDLGLDGMARELIDDFHKEHRFIETNDPVSTFLMEELMHLEDKEGSSLFYLEGGKDRPRELEGGEMAMAMHQYQSHSGIEDMDAAIGAFLRHSKIKEKLQKSDFDLTQPQFIERLIRTGLSREDVSYERFFKILQKDVKEYADSIRQKQPDAIEQSRAHLWELLQNIRYIDLPSADAIRNEHLDRLLSMADVLEDAQGELGDLADERDSQIKETMGRFLEEMSVRKVFEIEELPGVAIKVEKTRGEMNYTIRITGTKEKDPPLLIASILRDNLLYPHIFVLSRSQRSLTVNLESLRHFYQTLLPAQKIIFVEEIQKALSFIAEPVGEEVTFVLPADFLGEEGPSVESQGFMNDLFTRMTDPEVGVDGFVIGGLRRVNKSYFVQGGMMGITDQTLRRSRPRELSLANVQALKLSYITAVRRAYEFTGLGLGLEEHQFISYREALAHLYLQLANHRVSLKNNWLAVEEKLKQYALKDPSSQFLAKKLENRLRWTMEVFAHDDYYRAQVIAAFDLLGAEYPDRPLEDHQVHLAYLKQVTSARFKDNILRLPVARLVVRYRLLQHLQRKYGTAQIASRIEEESVPFYAYLKDALAGYSSLKSPSERRDWTKTAVSLKNKAEVFLEGMNQFISQLFPDLSLEQLEEMMLTEIYGISEGALKTQEQRSQATERVNVLFEASPSGREKYLVLFSSTPERKAKGKASTKTLPEVHISPVCPVLSHARERGDTIQRHKITPRTRLNDDLGKYTLCKMCPHNVPHYRPGTPPFQTWEDITKRYSDKGLGEEEAVAGRLLEASAPEHPQIPEGGVEQLTETVDLTLEEQAFSEDVENGPSGGGDQAQLSEMKSVTAHPGGIDMDPAWLNLENQGEGEQIQFYFDDRFLKDIELRGINPLITNTIFLPNLNLILSNKDQTIEELWQELSRR